MNIYQWIVSLVLALGSVTAVRGVDSPTYRSPAAVLVDPPRGVLYVAEFTGGSVAVLDAKDGSVRRRIAIPDPPSGLALSADGARLFVTGASPRGRLHVVDTAAGTVSASIAVGHTPLSPVLAPDGKHLYLCNQFDNAVAVVDVTTGTVSARIPVRREPMAAALTPDGSRLVVANRLPAVRADAEVVAAEVSLIDTASNTVRATIALPNGSTSCEGICVSPDGEFAYVTHLLAHFQQPATQIERGWMNTNALSIIEIKSGTRLATVLLDSIDLGAANPWGIACSADGKHLCVAHAGSQEISIINREALHRKVIQTQNRDGIANDLAFLTDMRRRVALSGNGPRGIAVADGRVFAAEYFSDSIAVVDLARAGVTSWPLGPAVASNAVRRGERAFYDATTCFQHWQSCASCHPGARTDGLNWDLLNDGIGNPKNTRSMLLVHRMPPAMSLGVRINAEAAVRAGFRHIEFFEPDEATSAAVDAYLKQLSPVPSPYLAADGKLTPQQERGRKVFESADCVSCHQPPLYTNLQRIDIGIGTGMDADKKFKVPTLIEIWRTAPYLYDGRAATLRDVFLPANDPQRLHGNAGSLSPEELDDLTSYMLTL
jgi:YVTN family beta-propeller protein